MPENTTEEVVAEQAITVTATLADGTTVELPARHYEAIIGGRHPKDAGVHADHKSAAVQAAAYDWRVSGQSVKIGFLALGLQCGAHLVAAANSHAATAKAVRPPEARRALREQAVEEAVEAEEATEATEETPAVEEKPARGRKSA